MEFGQGGRENLEYRRAGISVLAGEDSQQGFALRGTGTLVDDDSGLAIALVNRPGPAEHARDLQAVQRGRAVKSPVDLNSDTGLAISVGWQRIELTGAAIGAIAIGELAAFKFPLGR